MRGREGNLTRGHGGAGPRRGDCRPGRGGPGARCVSLRLHDSLTGEKKEFEPLESGVARIYTCGPTVWNYAHVGNFRAFLSYDLLRRHLHVSGYQIVHVMNITDVDDRIIDQAAAAGITIREFTRRYEEAFFE